MPKIPNNMTFEEFNTGVVKAAEKAPNLGKSLLLNLDEGFIHIDMTQEPAVVTNEEKEADTIVTTSVETLDALRKGDLNPMMAMMGGKVKIKGDMGLAMKLQGLLG
ncbi:SCP2 sterol-binding domain-containing protein [Neolewinella agarilytica]|nr:SCP2 sterol-binding domain-containing protein [Neolewinella agarilytica]